MEKSIWYKKKLIYNTLSEINNIKNRLISIPLKSDPNRKISFKVLCPNYMINLNKRSEMLKNFNKILN